MIFVSYAQNFEDVMLWRALKNVEQGFYIDVGANDPEADSVTKAFYDRNWSGINIEPLATHFADLQRERPRDINLRCAAGPSKGEIDMWQCDIRGWASVDKEVIEKHTALGNIGSLEQVPMTTLTEICRQHAPAEIHFLKIDVEGFEQSVLEGMDFKNFRPWIVVVEALNPHSNEEAYQQWEDLLLSADYFLVYADGLNRFYLAGEHKELAGFFKFPPNVFDEFVRDAQVKAETRATEVETKAHAEVQQAHAEVQHAYAEVQRAHADIQQAQVEAWQAQANAHHLHVALQAAYNSRSWRLTEPLRWSSEKFHHLAARKKEWLLMLLKPLTRMLQQGNLYLHHHPELRKKAIDALNLFPRLKQKLIRLNFLTNFQSNSLFDTANKNSSYYHVFPVAPKLPETLLLPELKCEQLRWVRLTGHVEGHYSLAIVNRGLAGALEQVNQGRLQFVPYHGDPYTELPVLPPELDAPLHASLRRCVPEGETDQTISLVHHYPFIADSQPAGLRCILFFWEETSVPTDTIDHLNRHFDAVLVASEAVKRALINSGCRPSIFVIPIGVDHLITEDVLPKETQQPTDGQPLRFLHISSTFERKGADVLLAAYLDAFSADDAVELYIKTFPNPHNQIHALLETFSALHERPAKVIIDESPLDDAGLLELYRSAHAMVLPSRGEGFNLPAAEALALGLPVITTGNSGHADFCCQGTATLINFRFAASRSHLHADDACWLEPDQADLAAKLRRMRDRILTADSTLNSERQAGMHHVRNTYTWQNSARALLTSADWLKHHPYDQAKPLHIALLSPWNTSCGIAEYSKNLMSAMLDQQAVQLTVYCDDRTAQASQATDSGVLPFWTMGANDTVPAALARIGQTDAQVVLVQHQPSLFPLTDACCDQLAALHRQGKVVMLELHATLPLLLQSRLSTAAVRALTELDRIIVHKPEDLNHLLEYGLTDNVMLLTLGVIQPPAESTETETRAELGIAADALVLGSFGFALAHKGIDTLVETVKSLAQNSDRPVYLLAVNSIMDNNSKQIIEQCQKRARKLGVSDQIHWITDYRPIEECQKLLCAADYIIFPYKYTRESASAAVTIGLSTLKPVLVSPEEIFSDLTDVTWRMDGHQSGDIVRAIQTLNDQPETVAALVLRQQQWLATRDWNSLSLKLLTVARSLRREQRLAMAIAPARLAWQKNWAAIQPKQLLVDVSDMYYRDAGTGIQRVVHCVLNELFRDPPAGYAIYPIYGDKTEGFRYTGKFHPHGDCVRDEQPVASGQGDVFLGLDLAAHLFPEAEQQLELFRQAGTRIYYVIYDIIPLLYPQYTMPHIGPAFKVWLYSLARCADGLMCISDAVAQDVGTWLGKHAPGPSLPTIGHFHLGADIDQAMPTGCLPVETDTTLTALKMDTSFLMVGTLEPRKGHAQVLEAFELLWTAGKNCRLVLVGKQGWMIDSLAARLRRHPELNKRLFWLEGISDAYLNTIYQVCNCLIAASHAEGFGLPLIEAAQHKLPIIARDIPVFREVAGDYAYYFADDTNPAILSEMLLDWLELYEQAKHPKSDGMPWLTWKESTRQLMTALLPEGPATQRADENKN